MERELLEETGIGPEMLEPEHGWHASLQNAQAPIVKVLRSHETADALQDRILSNLAAQPRPEFCAVSAVRDLADVGAPMPPWMQDFFRALWE